MLLYQCPEFRVPLLQSTTLKFLQWETNAEHPLARPEAGYSRRQYSTVANQLDQLFRRERPVTDHGLAAGKIHARIRVHPMHDPIFRIELLQAPQPLDFPGEAGLYGAHENVLSASELDLGQPGSAGFFGKLRALDLMKYRPVFDIQQMPPALGLSGDFNLLSQNEPATYVLQRLDAVSTVEYQKVVFLEGNDYGMALYTILTDTVSEELQPFAVVGLVQCETVEGRDKQVIQ